MLISAFCILISHSPEGVLIVKKIDKQLIFVTAVVIVLGSILIALIYRQTNNQLKNDFLLNTMIFTSMLDVEDIKLLTGSTDDYSLREFQNLHSKFREIINISGLFQYIYIMKDIDYGQMIFLIDVGNENMRNYDPSLPGEIYHDVTDEMLTLYITKKPIIYGPVTDSWGHWVTALVPIIDPDTNEMIAFLGIDKDARAWRIQIAEKLAFPIFLVILIYYLTILSFKITKHKNSITKRSERLNIQKQIISELTLSEEFHSNNFLKKLELICQKVSDIMSVEVVSIWFVQGSSDVMECRALYTIQTQGFTPGSSVDLGIFENFIEERFNKNRVIAIDDVKKDKQFMKCYLEYDERGSEIKSVIYGSFYDNRRLKGYISLENYEKQRQWATDEEIFIDNITALIQQILERDNKEKTEIELIQTNYRFLNTLNKMMDGFIYFDKNLVCKYINSRTIEIFALSSINYIDKEIWDIIPEEFFDFLRDMIQISLYQKKEQIKTEFVHSLNKWIEFRVYSVDNDIACIFLDVSREKQKEKIFLENQRLSAIGETTTSFAHDFNNYLQVILANIQVMDSKLLEHIAGCSQDKHIKENFLVNMKKHINTIQLATNDAATRVSILQRFAGAKSAESQYNLINLIHLVQEALIQSIGLWKTEPEREGISIQIIEKYKKTEDILGNEGELRSVVYSLIQNAVEAMPQGGIINIETGSNEDGVYLHVGDSGCGMKPHVIEKIFEPFFTTKSLDIGKGLGLSNAFSIITEHRGCIKVLSSDIGFGTTFEIVLPFPPIIHDKNDETKIETDKKSIQILWVDDDEIIRSIAVEMFLDLGFDLTTAESGEIALDILHKKEFDILLTDIGMPKMNGWQLIEKIDENGRGNMKIAVISGWGSQISDTQKRQYNIEHVLSKPVKLETLRKLVEEFCNLD